MRGEVIAFEPGLWDKKGVYKCERHWKYSSKFGSLAEQTETAVDMRNRVVTTF